MDADCCARSSSQCQPVGASSICSTVRAGNFCWWLWGAFPSWLIRGCGEPSSWLWVDIWRTDHRKSRLQYQRGFQGPQRIWSVLWPFLQQPPLSSFTWCDSWATQKGWEAWKPSWLLLGCSSTNLTPISNHTAAECVLANIKATLLLFQITFCNHYSLWQYMSEAASCLDWWQPAEDEGALGLSLPPGGGPETKLTHMRRKNSREPVIWSGKPWGDCRVIRHREQVDKIEDCTTPSHPSWNSLDPDICANVVRAQRYTRVHRGYLWLVGGAFRSS